MTEKPAENGPVDPTGDEAQSPHAEAQPSPERTVPLLDDTERLDPEAEYAGAEDARAGHGAGPNTPPPPPPGDFPPPPPPPGGYPPPPPGGAFGPSQPTAGAFAARYGLIRPQQGRWFAGVAAAIGRATNTDPVLWRVLFGVLTLFGGVGLLVYLLGWLLIPAEGDTGSPAEALIGRGRSSTSALVTLGLAALTVIMAGAALSGSLRSALLGAAVIAGAAVLVSRGRLPVDRPSDAPPPPGTGWTPTANWSPTPPQPETPAQAHPPTTGEPFAPHGPYASSSPYAQSLGYAPAPPPMYPGLAPTPPPVSTPPAAPRERSRLGRLVMSLLCLVLGALLIYDVAGHSVPASAYLAAALGVIGLGLVVGAWLGRARWLIFPGLVLLAALMIASAVARAVPWHGAPWHFQRAATNHDVTWQPTSVAALDSGYTVGVGNGTLDLTRVDFRDHTVSVDAHADVGNMVVILPPDVDVDVTATVDGGNAEVLGQRWGGFGKDTHQVHDNGRDGPGGGSLQLNTTVNLGKLEVRR